MAVEKLGMVRRLDATRSEDRADGVGYPDAPIRPARDAILLLLAITLQQRLEDGGPVRLALGPDLGFKLGNGAQHV